MKKITNTNTKAEHAVFLMEGLFGGSDGAVERQEARGQSELVESEQLPTEITPEDKTELESAGVVFGPPDKDDPLFCSAKLPEGWKKQPTEHSMWSELRDESGKVRAMIFYKAAFYDRHAFIRVQKQK